MNGDSGQAKGKNSGWTREQITELWPQAKAELAGFRRHLVTRGMGITAAQLGLALFLADAEFEKIKAQPTEGAKA